MRGRLKRLAWWLPMLVMVTSRAPCLKDVGCQGTLTASSSATYAQLLPGPELDKSIGLMASDTSDTSDTSATSDTSGISDTSGTSDTSGAGSPGSPWTLEIAPQEKPDEINGPAMGELSQVNVELPRSGSSARSGSSSAEDTSTIAGATARSADQPLQLLNPQGSRNNTNTLSTSDRMDKKFLTAPEASPPAEASPAEVEASGRDWLRSSARKEHKSAADIISNVHQTALIIRTRAMVTGADNVGRVGRKWFDTMVAVLKERTKLWPVLLGRGCGQEAMDKALYKAHAAQLQALSRAETRRGTPDSDDTPAGDTPADADADAETVAPDETLSVEQHLVEAAESYSVAMDVASKFLSELSKVAIPPPPTETGKKDVVALALRAATAAALAAKKAFEMCAARTAGEWASAPPERKQLEAAVDAASLAMAVLPPPTAANQQHPAAADMGTARAKLAAAEAKGDGAAKAQAQAAVELAAAEAKGDGAARAQAQAAVDLAAAEAKGDEAAMAQAAAEVSAAAGEGDEAAMAQAQAAAAVGTAEVEQEGAEKEPPLLKICEDDVCPPSNDWDVRGGVDGRSPVRAGCVQGCVGSLNGVTDRSLNQVIVGRADSSCERYCTGVVTQPGVVKYMGWAQRSFRDGYRSDRDESSEKQSWLEGCSKGCEGGLSYRPPCLTVDMKTTDSTATVHCE